MGAKICASLKITIKTSYTKTKLAELLSKEDVNNVVKKIVKPSWVFDARSIVNVDLVKKSGMNLWRLGDGS